jgi:hypothetical protein
MESNKIVAGLGIAAVVAAVAGVGYLLVKKTKQETDAIRKAGEARVTEIYREMDQAMAAHVERMAELERNREAMGARHQEIMDALAVAKERDETLHLDHLTVLGDLANRTITAEEASNRLRALNAQYQEEAVAA